MKTTTESNPNWWTDKHTSAWERVKDAFARDWDQTKADFSKKSGHELAQNATDTVKQAAGKETIPPMNVPNAKPEAAQAKKDASALEETLDYGDVEPALRYGYGASSEYASHKEWDENLEAKLRGDWGNLRHDRSWGEVKDHVRSGWDRARKQS